MTKSEVWGLRRRWFAWGIHQVMKLYEPLVAGRKRELFSGLNGTVLEIGPGTGVNVKYFSDDMEWLALEYNEYMFPYLEREAERHSVKHKLIQGSAEEIPLPDNSVDFVIGTLVLCSVPHPDLVINEIRRVLKPGGRYIFVEHVAAPNSSVIHFVQRMIRPLWSCCADGCNPNRRSWETIEQGGFDQVFLDHFRLGVPVVSPHISGTAINPH